MRRTRNSRMTECKLLCVQYNTWYKAQLDRTLPKCFAVEFNRDRNLCELHHGTPDRSQVDSPNCPLAKCRILPMVCPQ